ncbi:MAG: hypothetical protein O3A85_11410 [Proteobacteria bacterium]|nr:hypothetical protein [Pseudomonadota bacterium]
MGAATGGIFLTKSLTSLNTKYLADMGLIGKAADQRHHHHHRAEGSSGRSPERRRRKIPTQRPAKHV